MGFIAKSTTNKRVAPASAPLNAALSGDPWLTTGAIPTGAIVRSVAFTLGTRGLASTSAASVGLLTPQTQSSFWVTSSGSSSWTLYLGVQVHNNISPDWQVDLKINKGSQTAAVATPRYRTLDDALANGTTHDKLRDELLRALSLGQAPDNQAEFNVSAASLQEEQEFYQAPPERFRLSFGIATALDQQAIRERLGTLGHRVIETTPATIRWGLGLPAQQAANHVSASLRGPGVAFDATIASEQPSGRRIAAQALAEFIKQTMFRIKRMDAGAVYQGPREWAP